jgi:hypothetical protein
MKGMRFLARLLVLIACAACANLATRATADDGEEFTGPFPSWRDLRRDYKAIGDGKADDTAALQRAFDDLVKHQKACVLYVPSGTYRITQTIKTERKAHTDCQGIAVTGEDPATTTLVWDGASGGTMVQWDAWYSKISRLSLDAARRADICLQYGPAFSTYNETSDMVFKNAKTGLLFGGEKYKGQAENEVLRCQFLSCDNGLMTAGWNSMDIWVWYCRFLNCGRGVHNIMGNWHVWESYFEKSRTSDLSIANLMAFSAVNNTSAGSKCFFDFTSGHVWGSPSSVTGNRILDPTGDWGVILGNGGPYLVVDNYFRLPSKARGVKMTWGDQTLVGNAYTKNDAVEEKGRFRRIAEKIVEAKDVPQPPELPKTPARQKRKVFEVRAGAFGPSIQEAINSAAKLAGQRPVVHLPMGEYKLAAPLVIPAGCDLQLVGDGAGETATRITWAGRGDGPVLILHGPSRATLRDFYVHAGQGRGIVVENADQKGGRIFADQLNTSGPSGKQYARTAALRVRGLDQTDVLLRALQGNGNSGAWVEVIGGPKAAEAKNQVSILTGATGSAAGQYDVKKGSRLVVRAVYHEKSSDSLNGLHLTDSGTLCIDATRFSYATSKSAPTVAADNFRGTFTLATCMLMPVDTKESCRFELRGSGSDASVLALNNEFWVEQPGTTAETVWSNKAEPPAHGGLVGCSLNGNAGALPKGFAYLANVGDLPNSKKPAEPGHDARNGVDDATILRHLAPLRAARVWLPSAAPQGVTDLRIHRVMVTGGRDATVEFTAGK